MSRVQNTPVLTVLLAGLVGLGVFLALGVRADGGEDPESPFVYPTDSSGEPEPIVEPAPRSSAAGTDLWLTVDLVRRARLKAPAARSDATPMLLRGEAPVPCDAVTVIAGAAGDRTRRLVRFDVAGGPTLCRVVGTAGVANLWPGGELRGRVTSEAGEPVADAEIWAGVLDADGRPVLARSSADGSFVFPDSPGGSGIPLTVHARGLASRFSVVDHPAHLGRPQSMTLAPECRVGVVFAAEVDRPELGLVTAIPAALDTDIKHYPFFWPAIVGATRLDASGTATIDGLPRGSRVEIGVTHPLVPSRTRSVELRRPAVTVVVSAPRAPLLSGTVASADGSPLGGARIVVRPRGVVEFERHAGWLLPRADHHGGGHVTTSGSDGRFSIGRLSDAPSIVEVTAPDHFGIEVEVTDFERDLERDFVLPRFEPATGEPKLVLGFEAKGRALQIRHRNATWFAWSDEAPYELTVGEPAVVDLVVTADRGDGEPPTERAFLGLPVAGVLKLDGF